MASSQTMKLPAVTISLEDGGESPKVPMGPYSSISYQFNFDADGGNAAGNIYLEASNDGVLWSLYPDSTLAFTSATISHLIEVRVFKSAFIRAAVENTSGTGGTVSVFPYLTINME